MALVFRRRVGSDIGNAYRWYENQRAGLGEELLADLDLLFTRVDESPQSFVRVHHDVRRALLNRFPYAVFFFIEASTVVVLAVLHTSRDPRVWPSR